MNILRNKPMAVILQLFLAALPLIISHPKTVDWSLYLLVANGFIQGAVMVGRWHLINQWQLIHLRLKELENDSSL